jgi:hypothetical protein
MLAADASGTGAGIPIPRARGQTRYARGRDAGGVRRWGSVAVSEPRTRRHLGFKRPESAVRIAAHKRLPASARPYRRRCAGYLRDPSSAVPNRMSATAHVSGKRNGQAPQNKQSEPDQRLDREFMR